MRGSLAIIGAGRVGRALGRRLHELGWKIGAVVTQSESTARKALRYIGAGHALATISRRVLAAQVILIATPDAVVEKAAQELARIGAEELHGKIVLHTSGALGSNVLDAARRCGASVGSMHPLQSFSGVSAPPLEGKVFAIEGDPAAVRIARQMARALGASPISMEGGKKPLYHAAGALAAGSILSVMEAATQMMMRTGMNRRQAMRALLPLTRQVLENFERLGPRAAWTGPLSRGDFAVVASHAAALQEMPGEFLETYEVLNRLAARVLSKDFDSMLPELQRVAAKKKAAAQATGGQT